MKVIPFKVRVDPERYSESSKRSYGYEIINRKNYYSDINYTCSKCKADAVYTALEQKKSYENRKEYICSTRILCGRCWHEKRVLKKEAQLIEKDYCENKEDFLKDEAKLMRWLWVLIEYSKFTYRYNKSRVIFLEKHLKNFT
jgi:hypothetical protein